MKKTIKRLLGNDRVEQIKNYLEEKKPFGGRIKKRQLFYSKFLKSGDIFFDVGANLGNRVEPILNIGGIKVIAIEPQESCIRYLNKKFGDKITVVDKGLSSCEGIQKMYISNVSTVSSFSQKFVEEAIKTRRYGDVDWDKNISIEMTTLDLLIKQHGIPSFIKIDVEGYEYDVLQGLSIPIKNLSFEYNVPEMLDNVDKCLSYLSTLMNIKCNYSIGDTMEFTLKNWVTFAEMRSLIREDIFLKSGNGDIYVSLDNQEFSNDIG